MIYRVELPFDTLVLDMNLTEASAPIRYQGADEEWFSTPFQTADARHRDTDAAVLVIGYLGAEYWHDPSKDRPEDETTHIRSLIRSIDQGTAARQ